MTRKEVLKLLLEVLDNTLDNPDILGELRESVRLILQEETK